MIAMVGYCAAWLLTISVGSRQARAASLKRAQIDASYIEIAPTAQVDGRDHVYSCRVVSYVPFVVSAALDVYGGPDSARGTTDLYLWFGVLIYIGGTLDWIT